jgi:hypothetical protein
MQIKLLEQQILLVNLVTEIVCKQTGKELIVAGHFHDHHR